MIHDIVFTSLVHIPEYNNDGQDAPGFLPRTSQFKS